MKIGRRRLIAIEGLRTWLASHEVFPSNVDTDALTCGIHRRKDQGKLEVPWRDAFRLAGPVLFAGRRINKKRTTAMKTFTRQTRPNTSVAIDFGAASDQVARVFDPEVYPLRVESARVIQKNGNTLIAIDLVEVEDGGRVALQPIWIDGPNANAGTLAYENRHIIAQLLALAGKPTAGDPLELVPSLAGLTFDAHLIISPDTRTGRIFNAIGTILVDGRP
jgi:hypothetical protein